jgi:hypothetical protein
MKTEDLLNEMLKGSERLMPPMEEPNKQEEPQQQPEIREIVTLPKDDPAYAVVEGIRLLAEKKDVAQLGLVLQAAIQRLYNQCRTIDTNRIILANTVVAIGKCYDNAGFCPKSVDAILAAAYEASNAICNRIAAWEAEVDAANAHQEDPQE